LGVINSRLFTTVRDSLGLTYDVSFEVGGLVILCVCGGGGVVSLCCDLVLRSWVWA
jgi:hypothetical protein